MKGLNFYFSFSMHVSLFVIVQNWECPASVAFKTSWHAFQVDLKGSMCSRAQALLAGHCKLLLVPDHIAPPL